jgi:hypothetical protein
MILSTDNTIKLIDFGETQAVGSAAVYRAAHYGDPLLTPTNPTIANFESDDFCAVIHVLRIMNVIFSLSLSLCLSLSLSVCLSVSNTQNTHLA